MEPGTLKRNTLKLNLCIGISTKIAHCSVLLTLHCLHWVLISPHPIIPVLPLQPLCPSAVPHLPSPLPCLEPLNQLLNPPPVNPRAACLACLPRQLQRLLRSAHHSELRQQQLPFRLAHQHLTRHSDRHPLQPLVKHPLHPLVRHPPHPLDRRQLPPLAWAHPLNPLDRHLLNPLA